MGQTQINKSIDVIAKFAKGTITPLFFKFEQRVFKIESIDLSYEFKKGNVNFWNFSVSSNGNSYKIIYSNQTYQWTLEEIFTP